MYKYTFYNKYRSAIFETAHPIPLQVGQEVSLDFPENKMESVHQITNIRPGFSSSEGVDFYVEVD